MNKIFFLHTPKTAGRTLLSLIRPLFQPEEILYGDWPEITPRVNPSYGLVAGHLYLRAIPLIQFGGHYRITILRDPIDQAVSHYYHINERKARDGYIEEYFQQALDDGLSPSIMNGRFKVTLDTAIDHLSSFSHANASVEENIGSAKTNLNYFDAVGFVEHYDPFIRALGKKFGIDVVDVPVVNPPKWKPREIPLTREARTKLREMLEHEYWLYNYARRTFEDFKVT